MSVRVVLDTAKKLELAEQVADTKFPKELFEFAFNVTIEGLEKITSIKIEPTVKERVWNAVAPEQLQILKRIYLQEVCNKVLANLEEKDVQMVLQEDKETHHVDISYTYDVSLQAAFELHKADIVLATLQENKPNVLTWHHKIVEALKVEGIPLQEAATALIEVKVAST